MSKLYRLLGLLIVALLVVSCAPAAAPTEEAPVEEEEVEEPAEEEAEEPEEEAAEEETIRIGFVVHVTGIEFTAVVGEGATDAAEDYGVELVFTGPPAVDHPAQIAAFESLVETEPDAIVFIAGDPSVWEEPVQRAVDKGVLVLTADADAPNTARHAFFGVDAKGLGRTLGDKVRELVGDEAKIVLGECVIGPEPHVLREEGFREAFEGAEIDWVGPVETICDATDNFSNWQNAYTANQDATVLVGLTAVETPSLGKLKSETGGDYVVASFDPGAEGLRQMMEGNVDVCVGQNAYMAGYMPVQAAALSIREGKAIKAGLNLYPGELIVPEDAESLVERESGGEPRTEWYKNFLDENDLREFGLE
jgi:ABC-type sugar transport system substrate-binding protein